MGQQLFKIQLDTSDNAAAVNSTTVLSDDVKDDVSFLFPRKTSFDPTINPEGLNDDQQISSFQTKYIKQIRKYLFLLTQSTQWEEMNTEINDKFITNVLTFISEQKEKRLQEQNNHLAYKEQLQTSLTTKLNLDNDIDGSIFPESLIDPASENNSDNDQQKAKQVSYFGIQSLTSVLLILIKSAEKTDPTIVHQILTLTGQLCEQLPMKCLSSADSLLFLSLTPVTNYINELSLSKDQTVAKQTMKILLSFSMAKGSFKDLLYLLNKLIFNTTDIYNVQGLVKQMNNCLTETIKEYEKNKNNDEEKTDSNLKKETTELISLNYLKSINSFPNTQLTKLNKELFTGQLISSIILSHIDIENETNLSSKQSRLSSISCEFHPNTFKDLFDIIEQLTTVPQSNNVIHHILTISLRLFTTHLQLLSDVKSCTPDLTKYATDDELKKWFELFLELACNDNSTQIAKEALKAFMYVGQIKPSLLIEKLPLIHQYIIENKHPILIEQMSIELKKNETLSEWIEILCDENKKITIWNILYSFIDLYFNGDEKQQSQMKEMLFSFEHLLISKLIVQCETKSFTNNNLQLSTLIIQYLTYIFKICINQKVIMNDLLNSILIGLCLMTDTEKTFVYEVIQPIFLSILPLLAEYYLLNLNNEYSQFIICLIGKMCHLLIIGLPQDSVEIKHINQFKLSVFSGGCSINKTDDLLNCNLAVYSQFELVDDIQDDQDFLMSIYNNINEGAQLISKLKLFVKDKQRLLQKSIEEQANDACAATFAVYIKHYRRINLAKSELLRTAQNKPSSDLLSIYEYATRIQTLFATVKGQGGDCDELFKQIKMRTLFLLLTVKESDLIPMIKEDLSSLIVGTKSKIELNVSRQRSRWTKAKSIFKLLQNILHVGKRFKKLMLEQKQTIEQKNDYESLLNRSIDNFICGDFSKSSTNEDKQLEIDELDKCLHRQHQRALIRLITYRFIKTFIQNILHLNNNDQSIKILSIYLPYLRKNDIGWSYFNDIQASNNQLKNEISNTYYSIIKLVLPLPSLSQNIFCLLNLSYESIDISHLYDHQMIEILFNSFVSLIKNPEENLSINFKFTVFNWFRLFIFKLCENIEIERLRNTSNEILQKQQKFVFNSFIRNEIRSFKENISIDSQEQKSNSLKNLSLCWFLQPNQSMELYVNQYLAFLLRSMHFCKGVLSVCATNDYLQEFLSIYYDNQSNITRLLIIRVLRYLIPYIPDNTDGISRNLIIKFLSDVLYFIGDNNNPREIVSELISMYRIIMSMNCSWQMMSTELVFNSIKSYLNIKSIERNDKTEMTNLLSSLCILGGYIESYRLGSIVKMETNAEYSLALILNIDETDKSYLIQYLQTNQIESVSIDKLQLQIDVLPPNLVNINDPIVDILGYFIQIDTSTNKSLILLELKRCCISVLYHLLNDKNLIEIFLNKPYASILAKLSLSNSFPKDFRIFNKQHFEQYYLSLDKYQIIEDDSISINDQENSSFPSWNRNEIDRDQSVIDSLSTSMDGWKSYASEDGIEYFKQGRIGNDEISIVPTPSEAADPEVIEECGIKHRFRGRLAPTEGNTRFTFSTFIIDNLQLSEGKWYYCVRLSVSGVIQIGWATNGFSPSSGRGVGDDTYSWSYDGSQALLYYGQSFGGQFDGIKWKDNDVCGCGIEIDGKNTRIKYWLNGKLLGTAFVHDLDVPNSSTKCNLLQNGSTTTYYPAVSIVKTIPLLACELIFSPEDMQDCPLPDGYKPLLLPKCVQIENSIVEYPFNAYLIDNNPQDSLVTLRKKSPTNVLRDFVNEEHLETTFNLDDHYLNLPENSDGFPLSLDNDEISTLTISFDFQIVSTDGQLDFSLFKLGSTEISWTKTNKKQQCVIIFLSKERQIKVYINNQYQIFHHTFEHQTINKLNIHILPRISARIQNLAIWKYDLSEEQISRLFNYGLFYIGNVYRQLKEYRKQVNTISFSKNQEEFVNELLIPFNEPFTELLWENKKKQVDNDESKYFKSHNNRDYSTVELFSNKTYLVLNKSNEKWRNYTLLLDISIPQWPITNEKLTLITLNSKSELYITEKGELSLQINAEKHECSSPIILNEYFRLFISVHDESIQIYINNYLQIDRKVADDSLVIESNRIDLFKEIDLTKNTTNEDTLRISLKSIIYLNRSISIDHLQSPTLLEPPFGMIESNLIAMGYKKHWIESVMKQNKTKDIPRILREKKQEFIERDLQNDRDCYIKIISKFIPSMNSEVIKDLINSSTFDTNEQITDIAQRIYTHLISSQSSNLSLHTIKSEENWFSQSVEGLDIPYDIVKWVQDEILSKEDKDDIYQLLDLSQLTIKKSKESIEYSHQNLSSKEYLKYRIICEDGLMRSYARSTILKIFEVWSYDESILFPLEKFNDYRILKLIDYTKINKDEKINRIYLLIKSIIKTEIKQLLQHTNSDSLQIKVPLFYYLQKDIIIQLIHFLFKPSLLNTDPEMNKFQPNPDFVLSIIQLFGELLIEKSFLKQHQIDSLILILFPPSLINLIFDLFLLIPTHQSKISILYLFNSLLRISDSFILNNHIQQFFFQLLIDLSSEAISISNYSKKKVQLPLTDLIFSLLIKQNNPLEEYRSKLPENIQMLFTAIDVINVWNDSTKQKLLPEKCLEESNDILGDKYKLNQEDFEKSNKYFNITADRELINLINDSLLIYESFSDFIQTLPSESEPNVGFYKTYISLSNIPVDFIQIRARFIYFLNKLIETTLSTIDFTLSSEQSFLTDQIRTTKLYLLPSTKFKLFNESLQKTEIPFTGELCTINFDTIKASTDTENSENTMFYQAYQQLYPNAHKIFRQSNDQVWRAQYIGMYSSDAGGPFRDSITRICSDICSTRLSLFILCSNGRTNSGLNRDCWIPNVFPPNKSIPNQIEKQYRFIGQLMGMAIRRKHYLDIKFPSLLWKQLLNEPITTEDIEAIDIQSFSMINEMDKNIEQIKSMDVDQDIDSLFSSIMSELQFDVISSSGQTYELIPDGKDISLTAANFKHYCSCYREYRRNEFNRQINLIREGLYSIIPSYYLSLFTANELEEAVCGKGRIDVEIWKRNTSYGGEYNQDSPPIERFWTVISNIFTDEQKRLLLTFVWGRSTLPTRDEDFQSKFTITTVDVYGGEVDKALPRSHTCFFTIDLPAYSTTEVMYDRLNYAISSCSSIDGDGSINAAPDTEHIGSDDDSD